MSRYTCVFLTQAARRTPVKRVPDDLSALLDVSNLDSPGVRTRAMARKALPTAAVY